MSTPILSHAFSWTACMLRYRRGKFSNAEELLLNGKPRNKVTKVFCFYLSFFPGFSLCNLFYWPDVYLLHSWSVFCNHLLRHWKLSLVMLRFIFHEPVRKMFVIERPPENTTDSPLLKYCLTSTRDYNSLIKKKKNGYKGVLESFFTMGAQWCSVSALDFCRSEGQCFRACSLPSRCFLRQETLIPHSLSPPRCIKCKAE